MTIDILMSTYNGAQFLRAQVDSILSQDHTDIRLLIRDDGSVDSTHEILSEYEDRDARVKVIRDDLRHLGAFPSFMELVGRSEAPFFMFADQDDIWLPDKVAITLDKMASMIDLYGPDVPLVIFTDMSVVDEELNIIAQSLWVYQGYDPAICNNWKMLLAQNFVLGCTLMGNAKVRSMSLPFELPELAHDHWVALHAAKYGKIDFVPRQTMLYRQHHRNYSGANEFGLRYSLKRFPGLFPRIGEFMRSSRFFGDVSTLRLVFYKIWLNLRRFQKVRR